MSEVQTILKMIETVDQSDTTTLDEIDARVWCWLRGYTMRKPPQPPTSGDPGLFSYQSDLCKINFGRVEFTIIHYTRSRDALKKIRPQGSYWFKACQHPDGYGFCEAGLIGGDPKMLIFRNHAATEELAELHAIIQAIDHDRLNVRQPELAAN